METPQESDVGYPEEQPDGVTDQPQPPAEDKPQRSGGRAPHADTGNEDEGTATGNPNAAGGDE